MVLRGAPVGARARGAGALAGGGAGGRRAPRRGSASATAALLAVGRAAGRRAGGGRPRPGRHRLGARAGGELASWLAHGGGTADARRVAAHGAGSRSSTLPGRSPGSRAAALALRLVAALVAVSCGRSAPRCRSRPHVAWRRGQHRPPRRGRARRRRRSDGAGPSSPSPACGRGGCGRERPGHPRARPVPRAPEPARRRIGPARARPLRRRGGARRAARPERRREDEPAAPAARGSSRPSSGRLRVAGVAVESAGARRLATLRRDSLGLVHQHFRRSLAGGADRAGRSLGCRCDSGRAGRADRWRVARCSGASRARRTAPTRGQRSCRAASSSGWRCARRWSSVRAWCSRTSRPAELDGAASAAVVELMFARCGRRRRGGADRHA